jgi:hypothetical protein
MGGNNKIWLMLWNFMIWTYFREYIPSQMLRVCEEDVHVGKTTLVLKLSTDRGGQLVPTTLLLEKEPLYRFCRRLDVPHSHLDIIKKGGGGVPTCHHLKVKKKMNNGSVISYTSRFINVAIF